MPVMVKLLVFAHTPPPHHGQSYMVRLLLDDLGGDRRRSKSPPESTSTQPTIACYHVNARLSRDLADIGQRQLGKIPALLWYCLQAIWCRFRHGVPNFYYVPAPGRRHAIYRDWLVMLCCRPFFKRLVLHWHAAGLGHWLEHSAHPWERWLTCRLLGRADLSIIQSRNNDPELAMLKPKREVVIPCGIPDPAAEIAGELEARRNARFAVRQRLFNGEAPAESQRQQSGESHGLVRIFYLGLCTRTKGLFDALDAVALLNRQWAAARLPLQAELVVAGKFWEQAERAEFEARCRQPDLQIIGQDGVKRSAIEYLGFLDERQKRQKFIEADAFCFPTYYESESFGLVLVEAMAFGLPIVTTKWRGIPELFPPTYPGIVEPRSPQQTAAALDAMLRNTSGWENRKWFLEHHQLARHLEQMRAALAGLED